MRYLLLILITSLTPLLPSCAPISRVSGYVPSETEMSELRIGFSTKEEVISKLGEPLNSRNSQPNFLLYVQKRVETVAFLRPQIDDRKVAKLTFDDNSLLIRIDIYNTVTENHFDMDQNIVASEGRKLSFWQQMFGNIGNFSSEQFLD